MTWAYITNPCTLALNKAWGNVNLQGFRKGLYTEVFFMFFVYFISQVLHTFKYKNSTTTHRPSVQHSFIPTRISQLNEASMQGKDEKLELPWHQKRWNRIFAFMFSSHCIAIGMVILFSPLAGALVVAYLHLLLFFLYCICELRCLIMGTKILKVLMDILNIVLMIIGTVGINYAQYCKNSNGYSVCCHTL